MTPTLASSTPLMIEARGLGFARRDEGVFGPLDFALSHGEIGLIEGDNGSGKTTLLRVLAGLLRPSYGTVQVLGAEPGSETAREGTATMGHLLGLKADLSALENLRIGMGLYGHKPTSGPFAMLTQVGLEGYADEPVRSLSAGQKKRVALARLALLPARLWLLDEPYANLDRHGINLVNDLLTAHAAAGGTALVTSHGAVSFHQGVTCTVRLAA
ncbi:ABC transporter, heme export, CcmA [mine drainage metagenome]|uniref:ABC transporter, heme export, CcmA n=1 Tax=mine drainage metagenome TaxID=410659 RepID=T1CFH2_9ZZZZ